MSEPTITINGMPLSQGEAMTIRVAIECFLIDLHSPDLKMNPTLANGYRNAIETIREKMLKG